MRPFRYLFDPLFIASLVTYTINRFVLKPNFTLRFLHDHLNDLLCIPLWVPIGLFIERRLKLRTHDRPPEMLEILIPLLIWAWIFEVLLPANDLGRSWCTPDPADVAFYTLGAIGATWFWSRSSLARQRGDRHETSPALDHS
jgi:hypothetical protein